MSNILVLGGTSDIGVATAKYFADKGYSITLAGRNMKQLEINASDISIRTDQQVEVAKFEALETLNNEEFFKSLKIEPDVVLCAFGYLGDQEAAEKDPTEAEKIMKINYNAAVAICDVAVNQFIKKKTGVIVGISSVAGERGRKSNYYYGSSKAAFSAYLSGLRNRLSSFGIHVMTVKPGFVKTKMIEGMDTPKPLTASSEEVAKKIYSGVKKKKNIIYVKGLWKWVMLIIKIIPEGIFKKMNL